MVRFHWDRVWCFLEWDTHEYFPSPVLTQTPVSRQHQLQDEGTTGETQSQGAFPGMGTTGDRALVFLMAGLQK